MYKNYIISCTGRVGEDLPPDLKEVDMAFDDLSRLSVGDHTDYCPGYMRGLILLKSFVMSISQPRYVTLTWWGADDHPWSCRRSPFFAAENVNEETTNTSASNEKPTSKY